MDINRYVKVKKGITNNTYYITIEVNNIIIKDDINVAHAFNISFKEYSRLSQKFNSEIDNKFISFYNDSDCKDCINYLIKNYENDIIDFLIINTLNEKK